MEKATSGMAEDDPLRDWQALRRWCGGQRGSLQGRVHVRPPCLWHTVGVWCGNVGAMLGLSLALLQQNPRGWLSVALGLFGMLTNLSGYLKDRRLDSLRRIR